MGRTSALRRTRVRRRGPRPAMWLVFLLAAALAAFILVGRPAISRLAVDPEKETDPSPRITRDMTLEGLDLYLLCLARADAMENARIEAARYVSRGAAGYLMEDEEGVLIAGNGYDNQADAQKVADSLLETEGISARIVHRSASSLPLRVTAAPEQIEALSLGARLALSLPGELAAHALALDRNERTMDEVKSALSLSSRQLEQAARSLSQEARDSGDPVISGLARLLSLMAQDCEDLSLPGQDTLLSYSSKIKYAHLSGALGYIGFLQSLEN